MVPLALSIVGSFACRAHEQHVEIRSRKARALLSYLALSPGSREPRERLCGLLWSESSEDKARASLRQTLMGLKDALGPYATALGYSRQEVWLDRSAVSVDALALLDDLRLGTLGPPLSRDDIAGALLRDLHDVDPGFEVWANVQRELLCRQFVAGLEALIAASDHGQHAVAAQAADAILRFDPTHEGACRFLMRHHAAAGDIAHALRTYNDLWNLLEGEFDSEPSQATQDLVVAIKQGQVEGPPPTAVESGPVRATDEPRTVLIVSHFDDAGVDAEAQYLVFGFRHEFVGRLARFREWSVIDADPRRPEQVDVVRGQRFFSVDVTIRQAFERDRQRILLITLTVKQRPAGRYMWSESFRVAGADWFGVQRQFIGRIALALNVTLPPQRAGGETQAGAISPDTYDLWLRGHRLLSSWRADEREQASAILHQVAEEAPDFAPVYNSLVRLHNSGHIVLPGSWRSDERTREALRCANIAVRLEPLNSRAHLALGWSLLMGGYFERADAAFETALDLNDSDPWTLISAAQGLAFGGHHERAAQLASHSLDIDPHLSRPNWGYQVGIRYLARDYEGCVSAARHADDVISNLPAWTAAALAQLGQREAAQQEGARFKERIRALWQGPDAPTDETIAAWVIHSFPIRRAEDLALLEEGLRLAGLAG